MPQPLSPDGGPNARPARVKAATRTLLLCRSEKNRRSREPEEPAESFVSWAFFTQMQDVR